MEGIQQAREGITQAREGVEQTSESLEEMRNQTEALKKQIAAQRGEIDQLIGKRLELLRRQIDVLGQRVRVLPAERETAVRPQLAQLARQREEVAGILKAYRDAPAEKSAEILRQLDEALDRLKKEYEGFEAQIENPERDAGR